MRAAIILSLIAHVAVLQWVFYMLPSASPVELGQIEALPVDLVPIGEVTDIAKGQETPEPTPEPEIAKLQPEDVPTPAPEPEPPPPPPPPLPEHVIAPPEPEPTPAPEPALSAPEEVIAPLETESTPPPPEPVKEPEPPPPPPVEEAVKPPPPLPEHVIAPPPKVEPTPEPELAMAPVPKSRPRPPPPATTEQAPSEISDRIQALLDRNRELRPQETTETASLGTRTGRDGASMTQTEVDALRSRIVQCWSPPLGATGADELRTVVLIRLNRDGSLNGQPQIVSRPPGRYETTAPESVVRAIGRCAPYNLPLEKYAEWREIEFDFYPVDMF